MPLTVAVGARYRVVCDGPHSWPSYEDTVESIDEHESEQPVWLTKQFCCTLDGCILGVEPDELLAHLEPL